MRTFAIVQFENGGYIVTANPDGTVGLNAKCVAMQDKGDKAGNGLRVLVDQANAARELWGALDAALSAVSAIGGVGHAFMEADHVRAKYRGMA